MASVTASKLVPGERWTIRLHLWGIELSQFLLHRLEPGEVGRHWKDGITPDVVDFIIEKCKCAYCGSRIRPPLAPCACGIGEDWSGVDLAATFPRQALEDLVKRLYARQKGRLGSVRRALAVKTSGGKIHFREKADLFKVQEGLCFYCGESLVDQDGRNRYHCDHFVAVTDGGRSDLENSVLACARCNLLKNSDHGRYFTRRVRGLQLIKSPLQLAKMRKALGLWRKSRGLRALSAL